jgi:hypothetical protein
VTELFNALPEEPDERRRSPEARELLALSRPRRRVPWAAMKLPRITDEDVLAAIVELAGDGYCPVAALLPELPRRSHADRRRALTRSVNRGLLLERRAPDSRLHVAVTSEGWRRLREAA